MTRFAVVGLLTLLSGCASAPAPVAKAPSMTVEEVLKEPLLPNSIIRDGEMLSFQVSIPARDLKTTQSTLQIQASCDATHASLMFMQTTFVSSTRPLFRKLAMNNPLSPALAAILAQNPSFTTACAQTSPSDWRIVSASGAERRLVIDRNSIKVEGPSRLFWGAIDEPALLTDADYKVLFGQTRNRYQVDCTRQTYRVLSVFKLDEKDQIARGTLLSDSAEKTFGQSADVRDLLNAACTPTQQLSTLALYSPRSKVALSYESGPVKADVLKSIADLNLPPPQKAIKHLVLKSHNAGYLGSAPSQSEQRYETDPQSGQLQLQWPGKVSDTRSVNFRGLLTLRLDSHHTDRQLPVSYAVDTEKLTFTGDWRAMVVGSSLGYQITQQRRSTLKGNSVDVESVNCVVERQIEASQLNSSLQGSAKELGCKLEGGELKATATMYYLQDYGYFFRTRYQVGWITDVRTNLVSVE
ncbi:surface-adhesin E family protein [Pseudomonas sp. BGI-2]|uniref:surface-adhesin E family protein n=1 Tax=Pseudomonas sp. BGI-2 TaxID=2528211 RepID=UPI00103370D0|nr:surface-adhesin E family protein [Pseudomonas sp. BGI-2]TBN40016.1 hypothetical protein EYC95_20245 [Pseudomonas sp. BGI-2]